MSHLIKLGLSLLIIVLIINQFDAQTIWQNILGASPGLLVAALIMQLLSQSVAAYRWSLIMRLLQFKHPFSFYLKSYFKGSLFNQILPTSVGGDAYRVAEVAANGGLAKEAVYGVFIDRVVGLVGLLLLNLSANLFEDKLLPEPVFWSINLILVGALAGLVVLMGLHRILWLKKYKLTRFFFQLSERFRLIYSTRQRIGQQILLSVIIHLFSLLALFGIGHSLGINLSLSIYMVLIPPAILLTLLPISFAGWGVREGALVSLFMLIGANENQVLAMSFLYGIILMISALPGLYFYLTSPHKYF